MNTMTAEATDASTTGEAELLARLRRGEDAAFDELVRQSGGQMMAVARRMLRSEEDARDAVQEAFLNAFKALPEFDGRSRLATWLHRITVNCCLMRLRRRQRKPERSIEDMLPQFVEDGHQRTPSRNWNRDRTDGIEGRELRELVRAKIDLLPDQYRVVLMLRDIEELSTEEVGEVLGMSAAAVKTRLHRARQALRGLLDPYFAEETP
jgi:RNA polymerase sigma-70 factor (ECF subfamily)